MPCRSAAAPPERRAAPARRRALLPPEIATAIQENYLPQGHFLLGRSHTNNERPSVCCITCATPRISAFGDTIQFSDFVLAEQLTKAINCYPFSSMQATTVEVCDFFFLNRTCQNNMIKCRCYIPKLCIL